MYISSSAEFNEIIENSGRTFRGRIFVDSNYYPISSANILGSSNADGGITVGSTNCQSVDIVMPKIEPYLRAKEFLLQIGLLLSNGTFEYIPIGYFTPDEVEIKQSTISFTAYDRMAKMSPLYESALTDETTTTIAVLNEIASLTGVPIKTNGLPSYSMKKPVGYTYREALSFIGQLYGKFANVNREGSIEFFFWQDNGFIVNPSSGLKNFVHDSSYIIDRIDCVAGYEEVPIQSDESETENNEEQTTEQKAIEYHVGDGAQGFSLSNPFMTQEILNSVFTSIGGFQYDPVTFLAIMGDIRLDPWDLITVNDLDGNEYKVPLMSLQLKFDGGVSMQIESYASGVNEDENEYQDTTAKMIEKIISKLISVEALNAKKASITQLRSAEALIERVYGDFSSFKTGEFADLKSKEATFEKTTSENIKSINADIKSLASTSITTDYLDANFAKILMEEVNKAVIIEAIVNSMTTSGITVTGDAHVAGTFTGVEILGDIIRANTLAVKNLLLTGADGLIYQINALASGLTQTELTDEQYQQKLSGEDLIAKSVTANQIASQTLTADKLNVDDIFGNYAVLSKLYSNLIVAKKISTDYIEFGNKTITNYLNETEKRLSAIAASLKDIQLIVSDINNEKAFTTGSDISVWKSEEVPTLMNYPTFTDFFIWDICSDDLYCSEELICGTNDYANHLHEICCTSTKEYYIFELDSSNLYYWRKLSDSEYKELSNKFSSVIVREDYVRLISTLNDMSTFFEVRHDGIRCTNGMLRCC